MFSELDIGGRETCIKIWLSLKCIIVGNLSLMSISSKTQNKRPDYKMIDRSSSLITPITTIIFKVHEVNQKCCAKQSGLHLHIKIDWESHSEVLCVCEQFLFDTWPLFCNFSNLKTGFKEVKTMYTPHLRLIPKWHDVEVNVGAAVADPAAASRPLDGQDGLTALILHQELGLAEAPLLL